MFCREITQPAELEEVQALRYAVLVEELGRVNPHADDVNRRLAEPLDDDAIHLGAYAAGPCGAAELLGALRIHLPGRGDLRALEAIHPALLATDGPRTGVVSRLVTAPRARGGLDGAGLALARAAYRVALAERLEAVEIDCHASLIGFFEWLGFVVYRRFEHPVFGDVALLRSHPFDRASLEKAGSPLVEVFDDWAAREVAEEGTRRAQA